MDLEQLPQAWLLRFIQLLPNRLRLSLRQCSLGMLQLVDSHSSSCLTWRVLDSSRMAVAAQLCAGNVRHLDLSNLSADRHRSFLYAISHLSPAKDPTAGMQALCGRVEKITGRKDHGKIVCAAAAATGAGRLKELSVWCCSDCAGVPDGSEPARTTVILAEDDVPDVLRCPVAHINLLGADHRFDDLGPRASPGASPQWDWQWFLSENLQSLRCEALADDVDEPFWETLSSCLPKWPQITCLELSGHQGDTEPITEEDDHHLPQLQHLQRLAINSLDECALTTAALDGLVRSSGLTYVQLSGALKDFDVQVLSQLPSLQDLSLLGPRTFNAAEFRCFTAHNKLSSLLVESFLLDPVEDTTTAATGKQAQGPDAHQAAVTPASSTGGPPTGAGQQHGGSAVARRQPWSLQSLKRLSVGNIGSAQYCAPLAAFAPSLIELHDSFWDELPTKPVNTRGAGTVDALAGLQHLQVLDVDIFTLDRHAGHLAGLTGLSTLQELRVEMSGHMLHESVNLQEGLPCVPSLTKLLLYTKEDVMRADWQFFYCSTEDILLWQQQPQLRELAVRGSCRVGGFLTEPDTRAQLPVKLPALRCVLIEECPDLVVDMLASLVAVQPAPVVRVTGCKLLTERQCCEVSSESVSVEYA